MNAGSASSAKPGPALWVLAITVMSCAMQTVQAQQATPPVTETNKPIEEVVVIVGRDGKSVDLDALLLDEVRMEAIRAYLLEQHVQELESWRLRLRTSLQRKTSRIAWGYDAQAEAARFRFSQANFLPIDRVQPATFVSIRF